MILGFNGQKWEKKKASIARFLHIGFWLCSHKYRKLILNIVTSYLIHSRIWLNLVKDDCHFSYIFLVTYAMQNNNNNNNSLIKGRCKPRIMFHHVKGLIVEILTKCKLVHHITRRNNTKCAILIHKEIFFSHLPMDDLQLRHIKKNKNSLRKGWCKPRKMFHHIVNGLMVTNLTKCKPCASYYTKGAYKMCHPYTQTKILPWNRGLSYYHDSPTPEWNPKPNANQHFTWAIQYNKIFEEVADGGSFIAYKVHFISSVCPLFLH